MEFTFNQKNIIMGYGDVSNRVKNPVEKWYSWAGGSGDIVSYRKNEDGTGQEEKYNSLMLVVLDADTKTLGGYNDQLKSRLFSNFVNNLDHPFTLKDQKHKKVRLVGKYKDSHEKDEFKRMGARYANVLICYDTESEEIVGLTLEGAFLSLWMDVLSAKIFMMQQVTRFF